MKSPVRQFRLERRSDTAGGFVRVTAYLDDDPRLRVGTFVTLRDAPDPTCRWRIVERGEHVRERSEVKRTRTWSNNI